MVFFRKKSTTQDIAPDEIFLDSTNLPEHDSAKFEDRIERPVSNGVLYAVGIVFFAVTLIYTFKCYQLQIINGSTYVAISQNNTIDHTVLFADRGDILDARGVRIAWSVPATTSAQVLAGNEMFSLRKYTTLPGLSHVLGWVRYPRADSSGYWWRKSYEGMSGVELSYDYKIAGKNGSKMTERDARGNITREHIVTKPIPGNTLNLSLDAEVTSKLNTVLVNHARMNGFEGGSSVIMDVHTGEILAMTSFPEYDNQSFTDGDIDIVAAAHQNKSVPILNRAISGLYTPGSIVKPIFAIAALEEKIISPEKIIVSTGKITIPNPYHPDKPSIFKDWYVHGPVDMRTAIAVSSDEYFYAIGGGYRDQKGLGIENLDKYARIFGLATVTGIALAGEAVGNIPTPAWKEENFPGDPWRIGNTYHTAIGQYGFMVTPIQSVRFVAAIANNGTLLVPQIIASSSPTIGTRLPINQTYMQIVREGMRMAVTSSRADATVKSLNINGIKISAKTGTAQLGSRNQWMNSWSVGYWPADNPRYAYATVLEHSPAGTASGAAPGMRPFFEWLVINRPEYVK